MTRLWPRACAVTICAAAFAASARFPVASVAAAATASIADQPQSAGRRFVAIGCVSRAGSPPARDSKGSSFILTDTRGEPPLPPLRYRLDGDAEALAMHVGHTVEVAGPLAGASGGGGVSDAPVLKVDSLTYITNSCPKPSSSR